MLLPPLSVLILTSLAAAVQCSSHSSCQKLDELDMGESCKMMDITLGLCWWHQHNLLSFDLVPCLGMAVTT